MTHSKPANPLNKNQDLINIAILFLIALVTGVYLIVTTVVITKDGAWYIELAKGLSSDTQNIINRQPFTFSLLILMTHKLAGPFSDSSSLFTWIYSAQGLTLLCRLLSLIPLYFIGKLFVGAKKSFQAILILIILPYPAHFAPEVLREWPHILFLASGLLFLFRAVKQSELRTFAPAGFLAGLGYAIRPECAQIIIYGLLWIFISLLSPRPGTSRPKLLCALLVLLTGFAIGAAPYTIAKGQLLPRKFKAIINPEGSVDSKQIREPETAGENNIYTASGISVRIAKAIGELAGAISENLMYYFLPALLVGIYYRFRNKSSATEIERFFMPAFAALNVVMLIALYCSWGYISRRHCLPLVVFTIFYIPIGLQAIADRLASRFCKSGTASDKDCRRWFYILLTIGIIICLPKLLSRPGSDKPGYRAAAAWLKQNTDPGDLIATPDRRITFYAERITVIYETDPPGKGKYVVTIVKDESQAPDFTREAQKLYSVWVNKQKKKKIVIYKMSS